MVGCAQERWILISSGFPESVVVIVMFCTVVYPGSIEARTCTVNTAQ